jgi:hypothetical protein
MGFPRDYNVAIMNRTQSSWGCAVLLEGVYLGFNRGPYRRHRVVALGGWLCVVPPAPNKAHAASAVIVMTGFMEKA